MATIFYFTSTGNSLNAARRIAEAINAQILPMREEYAVCDDDVIGLVFPNYYWSGSSPSPTTCRSTDPTPANSYSRKRRSSFAE